MNIWLTSRKGKILEGVVLVKVAPLPKHVKSWQIRGTKRSKVEITVTVVKGPIPMTMVQEPMPMNKLSTFVDRKDQWVWLVGTKKRKSYIIG